MKKKELFLLLLIILVLTIFFVILNNIRSKITKEKVLRNELNEVLKIINTNNDKKVVKERLASTVTKENYKTVELAWKKYLFNIYNDTIKIKELLEDKKITDILTLENYKTDGKQFINTKEYIKTLKIRLNYYSNRLFLNLTNDGMMKYINKSNLDYYYINLYKECIDLYEKDLRNSINDLKEVINNTIYYLDSCLEVVNFLEEFDTMWQVTDKMVFIDEKITLNYNELLNKIK